MTLVHTHTRLPCSWDLLSTSQPTENDLINDLAPLEFEAQVSTSNLCKGLLNKIIYTLGTTKLALMTGRLMIPSFLLTSISNGSTPFMITLLQTPSVLAISAFASKVILPLTLLLLVRKVIARIVIRFGGVIQTDHVSDSSRMDTFNIVKSMGHTSFRINLNYNGYRYDSICVKNKDATNNWVLVGGGNCQTYEYSIFGLLEKFPGQNILFVNHADTAKSLAPHTSFGLKAGQEAGLQFLESPGLKAERIIAYGFSLGAGCQLEAAEMHETFHTDRIQYLFWSDRTFDKLSNAASTLFHAIAKPIFFILGIELDSVKGGQRLMRENITHIVTQHSLLTNNKGVLTENAAEISGSIGNPGGDLVINDAIGLYPNLTYSPLGLAKCKPHYFGNSSVSHFNPELPGEVQLQVNNKLAEFMKQPALVNS